MTLSFGGADNVDVAAKRKPAALGACAPRAIATGGGGQRNKVKS